MKHILYLTTIVFFLIPGISEAQDNWQRLIDEPTFGIAVNPYNPNSIIVGGGGRRLYFSTDAGKTWRNDSVEFTTASARFTNVFIHPLDTNIIIVGGINFGSIRRSTDGGKTWKIVFEPELGAVVLNGESMMSAPHNPNHVYFTRLNPPILYRSTDRGATWDSISTIPKANPDDPNELEPGLCTIAFRRDSSNIMLAGTSGGRIYKSIDTGKTWKPLPRLANYTYGDAEIPKIVFSKANPLVGYTIVAYFFPLSLPNGGLYKTLDGGNTWNLAAFADTSLWSVAVPLFGSPEEVAVGGFSDPVAPEFRVPGDSIVGISNSNGAWQRFDKEIPWLEKGEKNVWLLKYAGATPLTQKLYMATEAGFFVTNAKDTSGTGVFDDISGEGRTYVFSFKNSVISLKFPVPLFQQDVLLITDILGNTILKKEIPADTYTTEVVLSPEIAAGPYILHFLKNSYSPKLIVTE